MHFRYNQSTLCAKTENFILSKTRNRHQKNIFGNLQRKLNLSFHHLNNKINKYKETIIPKFGNEEQINIIIFQAEIKTGAKEGMIQKNI
ncbi:hypothetical protein [Maridesulfovibrio sp.]|uniref:hypothetical protein n=1 Tax=Maridesulfovibrio sp. TaxID=2795000 RepID=UPI003BA9DA53